MQKVVIGDEGAVRVITINRADVHNCVDVETAESLAVAIGEFAEDVSLKVLILTGAGDKAFCSGADLKASASLMTHDFVESAGPMGFARLDPGKPTIAAVNGYCFAGGMELAAWCDFRIASANAEFGALNRRWGVPFIDGGTQRFGRIAGLGAALYLMETGIRIRASTAKELGFVQEVVPAGSALDRARELAEQIAGYPQASIRADRKAAIDGLGMTLDDGLLNERSVGFATLSDPEMAEGLERFRKGDF